MAETEQKVVKPTSAPKKDFSDMTPEEQAAEQRRIAEAEAAANQPDPAFDRSVDKNVALMAKVFKGQTKYPVVLGQITRAQEASGVKPIPDREVCVNGYYFLIPRGVTVELPEAVVRILYQAGEISAPLMVQMKVMTLQEVLADEMLSKAEQEKLKELGTIQAS